MRRKQIFSYILLTCLTTLAVFSFCFFLCRTTLYLTNGSAVPSDIGSTSYVVTDVHPDEESQLITLHFTGVKENDHLAFVINDMGSFVLSLEAYLNGTEVYSYEESSPFQRIHIIDLPAELMEETGEINLTLSASGWQSRSQEILSGRLNAAPTLILCSYENALGLTRQADRAMSILIGMYLIIIVSSLTMFAGRTREFGYLFLSLLCLIRFFNTAVDSSYLSFTMEQYYSLRHILVVLPVIFHVSVGIWLLRPEPRRRSGHYLMITGVLTLLVTFFQSISGYNWYHFFQFLAFLAFTGCCLRAAVRGKKGWPLLCAGYTAGYAIVAFLYLVNIWDITKPGLVFICTNFTNFSYVPGLLASMIFISRQLVSKYNETEKLSARLSQANKELDKRVEEKTAQLVAMQESRQSMMLNIFHDLRNPVFILKGCLDNLQPANPQQRQHIKTMRTRLNLLETLIGDLFLLEKLNAGAVALYEDNVELDALIQEIADGLSASRDKTVVTDLRPAVVWGDETRLFQAFQNLAENARLYTPQGGTISLSVYQEGETAKVIIADTGIGMTEEECSHIFERYYTGKRSKKDVSSGLGLNIASQLIKLNRGSIHVESQPGAGTKITIVFPAVQAPEGV